MKAAPLSERCSDGRRPKQQENGLEIKERKRVCVCVCAEWLFVRGEKREAVLKRAREFPTATERKEKGGERE